MPLYANVIKVWPLTCDLCIKSCLDCPTHSPFQTTSFMNDPWDIHVLRYKRVLKIGISSVHHLTNEVYVVAISAHMQGCVIRIILLRYASLLYMEGRISNLRQRENAFSFINCWAENVLLNWHWLIEKSNLLTNEVNMKCKRIYQIRKLLQI